jgi:hypothetical protein
VRQEFLSRFIAARAPGFAIARYNLKRENTTVKFAVPVFVLLVGVAVSSMTSYAKPEYTKKEKKACTFCHVSAKSKELNDAGKYYKDHDHSFEGYPGAGTTKTP